MADTKRFTRAQVAAHNAKDNAVFIIHNYVYDVKAFLDEHPGGHEVLVDAVGKDASENFDDIGHSLDAKELMKKFRIGELVDEEKTAPKKRPTYTAVPETQNDEGILSSWRLPLFLSLLATFVYYYLF